MGEASGLRIIDAQVLKDPSCLSDLTFKALYQEPIPKPLQSTTHKSPQTGKYLVHWILNSQLVRGKLQYLVDWEGYAPDKQSWEATKNIHALDLL